MRRTRMLLLWRRGSSIIRTGYWISSAIRRWLECRGEGGERERGVLGPERDDAQRAQSLCRCARLSCVTPQSNHLQLLCDPRCHGDRYPRAVLYEPCSFPRNIRIRRAEAVRVGPFLSFPLSLSLLPLSTDEYSCSSY
jgi:hypothetical protein